MASLLTRPAKRTFLLAGTGLALWATDHYTNGASIERSLRTLYTGLLITADFKLNFNPSQVESIDDLHTRVAQRILNVCRRNGGLYIKLGQQIASVPVLPKQYSQALHELYDSAPVVPYKAVERIFQEEFGCLPSDIFMTFSRIPAASASIAQVHHATLLDGTPVAVKIQKPDIARQIGWDMACYKTLTLAFEWVFDLPLSWSADYIEKHLRQETDFINEGRNSERAAQAILQVPDLRSRVYVPKVYWDLTSRRILTCEWIDGVGFNNVGEMTRQGFSLHDAMAALVDVFADQIFRVGFVHCDPHPGNVIVRMDRSNPLWPRQQVVLLDHGLYVECTDEFRHDYALFWKSLFSLDSHTLERITLGWGIHDVQLFASATLQRPWKYGQAVHSHSHQPFADMYEAQVAAKSRLKHFLKNTEMLPKELIFIGRNLNCVRANNKGLGSPVNRINRMAQCAVSSLGKESLVWRDSALTQTTGDGVDRVSLAQWSVWVFRTQMHYWTFHTTLFLSTVGFWVAYSLQRVRLFLGGPRSGGFEAVMDAAMKQRLQDEIPGLVLDENVFDG
ncbi:hypothetical protein BASA61_004584 [Batrachochytrium salamandrivorans]|nr:hypothetical protein BASA62_003731 [Batrachochytrium salamandrivorans]KAH6592395.1 hypothetical protein BASA61_004584 [Batrachochytrium salamandrivorans]KAH9272717.1 hypothetical protein BASA83_004919 [Batrachochytrium salamandrivorans]KAJ1340931.1 hypothetical protein BSLG_004404 [Batrachochytrium salamandrivorans]